MWFLKLKMSKSFHEASLLFSANFSGKQYIKIITIVYVDSVYIYCLLKLYSSFYSVNMILNSYMVL